MADIEKQEYPAIYADDQQLKDIVSAEGVIRTASTLEEMRSALLTVCGIIKHNVAQSVAETDALLTVKRS